MGSGELGQPPASCWLQALSCIQSEDGRVTMASGNGQRDPDTCHPGWWNLPRLPRQTLQAMDVLALPSHPNHLAFWPCQGVDKRAAGLGVTNPRLTRPL